MEIFYSLTLTVHILVGLGVIVLVLIQHGKGADMGAAFGSGASGSVFGASGSANFLSRATAVLATMFFLTSLSLSYLATSKPTANHSVMDNVPAPSSTAATTPDPVSPTETSPAKDIPK